MILFHLRREDPSPLHLQIHARVVRLVRDGSLKPGDRLPATRALAQRLGVNRSTVYRAYQELWAAGYLESRPGSYTTVRARGVTGRREEHAARGLIDWRRASAPAARSAREELRRFAADAAHATAPEAGADGLVDFSRLAADHDLCPVAEFRRAVRQVLLRQGKDLLGYGDPAGYPPLRETIARRMDVHGVRVSADQILLVNGAQHGLDLALRLLARPGDRVAVESPTYALALPLLRLHGLNLLEVPLRPDGMDLDVLERHLARRRPALVYTIPNFHNPTGLTSSQPHRERLLALCERHRIPIVEDGFEEEMKYFGKAVLPIKSMDARGVVLYLGTFSKVVFPGLRVGWIAADRDCIERLLAINRFSSLAGATLGQAALDRFCRTGDYEQYLRRIHRAYRQRMQAMLRGLEENLPARGVEWTRPAGGYTLWVRLPGRGRDEDALLRHLRRHGVVVSRGSLFLAGPPRELCFRLSIASLTEPRIATGCRRLGQALAAWPRG